MNLGNQELSTVGGGGRMDGVDKRVWHELHSINVESFVERTKRIV